MNSVKLSKRDWIINIENAASAAEKNIGKKAVAAVFKKYGAHDAYDLSPVYYSEVFDELDFMANDN